MTAGDTYRITWQSSPNIDKVSIGFKSCPSCLDWIAFTTPNTGYFDWKVFVGNTTNTQFTIEITGYQTGVGSVTDRSDSAFTVIQPPTPTPTPFGWLTITSPNGGEVMTAGDTYRITWQNSPNIDTVIIGYKSCPSCLDWIVFGTPNYGYYDWKVFVGNTTNTQFTIYIAGFETGVGSVIDTSDGPFTVLQPPTPTPTITPTRTITPTPTIAAPRLIYPVNGSTITTLRPRLRWTNVPGASYYLIQASTSSDFSNLIFNVFETSSTFTPFVNLPQGVTIFWRVRAFTQAGLSDWSTGTFTIRNPIIQPTPRPMRPTHTHPSIPRR